MNHNRLLCTLGIVVMYSLAVDFESYGFMVYDKVMGLTQKQYAPVTISILAVIITIGLIWSWNGKRVAEVNEK